MALLHYANIEDHRPDILLQKTFSGLEDFYKYLENSKKYLESTDAVKRLCWEKVDKRVEVTEGKPKANDIWIHLKEPDAQTEESVFRAFLDENNSEVYEADHTNWRAVASPAVECSYCKQKNGKPKLAYRTEEHALEVAEQSHSPLDVYKCEHGEGWHLTKQFDSNRIHFVKHNALKILDRNIESEQLLLERLPVPEKKFLVLRPNTYSLKCQINAIKELQDSPSVFHRPLLRLFEASKVARWQAIPDFENTLEWHVLTDSNRLGTDEQRAFVDVAINTPDFAFLEGPPGSGKTTAILELIIQLALKGKRVLLCASTHVAVDNVLEKIMKEKEELKNLIIALRIGDKSNISEKVKPYQLEQFLATEKKRLLKELRKEKNLSEAQKELLEQLNSGSKTIQRMVLESANLICGTTIGILQHPDIKDKGAANPQFDYLIVDEASKTTFQEFLVPGLLAKRWILVGDNKQLSPYVDDESTAVNIAPCLPEEYKRNACLDVFQASSFVANVKDRISSLVIDENKAAQQFYRQQGQTNGVLVSTPDTESEHIPYSSIVIGNEPFISEKLSKIPVDIRRIRGNEKQIPLSLQYRKAALIKRDETKWESEVAWRIARLFEQRLNDQDSSQKRTTSQKLEGQIDALIPFDSKQGKDSVDEKLDRVKRVALPSILESLQTGFQRKEGQRDGTALNDGLPEQILQQRSVTLKYQHRMHGDIADFSHRNIYHEEALITPDSMEKERAWSYESSRKRSVWVDVKNSRVTKGNKNDTEALKLMDELKEFDRWAKNNPKDNGEPWEVAVLSFYRGQERALRYRLREWTKNHRAFRHFVCGSKQNPYLDIQVCTVDKFQGHEADLVLLSFTNNHPTSFLESPNRLNVAITRAKYGLVVFGNRNAMRRASGVLGVFAKESVWSQVVEVAK